jgi:hypothetical protein
VCLAHEVQLHLTPLAGLPDVQALQSFVVDSKDNLDDWGTAHCISWDSQGGRFVGASCIKLKEGTWDGKGSLAFFSFKFSLSPSQPQPAACHARPPLSLRRCVVTLSLESKPHTLSLALLTH